MNPFIAFHKLGTQRPGLLKLGGGAAITAPFLLSSEDRGPLDTALMTTPVISAFTLAYPDLEAAAGETASFYKNAPINLAQPSRTSYVDLREYMSKAGPSSQRSVTPLANDLAVNFFHQPMRKPIPVGDMAQRVEAILEGMLSGNQFGAKQALMSNALQSANIRAGLEMGLPGSELGFTAEQFRSSFAAGRGNRNFLQTLEQGLNRSQSLRDTGAVLSAFAPVTSESIAVNIFAHGRIVPGSTALDALQRARPEVATALEASISRLTAAGQPLPFDEITLIAEKVTKGQTGRLLGIHIKNRGEVALQIPIFNPETGTVYLGDNFNRLGVGRGIYTMEGRFDPDVFLAGNLDRDLGVLRKDISRAAYHAGLDPLEGFSYGKTPNAVLEAHAIKLRSRAAVPTGLSDAFYGGSYDQLENVEKAKLLQHMRTKGLVPLGSESGFGKGVLLDANLETLSIGGRPSYGKQSFFNRAFSKELQLKEVPHGMHTLVSNTAYNEILGLKEVPMVRGYQATISPGAVNLFGGLPTNISQLLDAKVSERAIKAIMKDSSLGPEAAANVYNELVGTVLSDPETLRAVRRFGSMGEGDAFLHPKFGKLRMQSFLNVHVDKLHLDPTKPFGSKDVIGFSQPLSGPFADVPSPVTSAAPVSFIESHTPARGGGFDVRIRQEYPIQTGAKQEIAGVKGLTFLEEEEALFNRARGALSKFNVLLGRGAVPNFVDVITPVHYTAGKHSETLELLLTQAAQTANAVVRGETGMALSMREAGFGTNPVGDYLGEIEKFGISSSYRDGELLLTAENKFFSGLSDIQRKDAIQQLTGSSERFINDVGTTVRSSGVRSASPLFEAFRTSGQTNLLKFMETNAMAVPIAYWDSSLRYVSDAVSVTPDLYSEMFRMGNFAGLKDIMGRVEYPGGAPQMTADMAQHVMGLDLEKAIGTVVPFDEAKAGLQGMGSAAGRRGGVFDPLRPDLQGNFSIDLGQSYETTISGRKVNVRYLPILGRQAHGGDTNLFGVGEVNATDLERRLAGVLRADKGTEGAALGSYFDELGKSFFGKSGYMRARAVDVDLSLSGFIQKRHLEDPFELVISQGMAKRIRNKAVREALEKRVSVYAVAGRHPIQVAPYMKVRIGMEHFLGAGAGPDPNLIGMDESIRALFGADDDLDRLGLNFMIPGSAGAQEAEAVLANANSLQRTRLIRFNEMYGGLEDARNMSRATVERQLAKSYLPKLIEAGINEDRAATAAARLAGDTVGRYSNQLTRLYMSLESHPTLGNNPEARAFLGDLFWPLRQAPIAAQKNAAFAASDPLAIYNEIDAALKGRSETNVAQFQAAMEKLGDVFDKGNYKKTVQSQEVKDLFNEFIRHRPFEADPAARLVSQEASRLGKDTFSHYLGSGSAVPYLRGAAGESRAASEVSHTLGIINRQYREAVGTAKIAFKPALGILGVGLGVAALAGFMTTSVPDTLSERPVASPADGPISMNRFRTEIGAATTDHVPGEPVPGSLSSVSPPRRLRPPRIQTRTAVVAPMRQVVDLEVTASGADRARTAEITRLLAQTRSSGTTNITVNNLGGERSRMSSLRRREQIRDLLEQQS